MSVLECMISPCTHLLDVPTRLRADWARAHVDIFQALEDARVAGDGVGTERMLKWYLCLHDVLLPFYEGR